MLVLFYFMYFFILSSGKNVNYMNEYQDPFDRDKKSLFLCTFFGSVVALRVLSHSVFPVESEMYKGYMNENQDQLDRNRLLCIVLASRLLYRVLCLSAAFSVLSIHKTNVVT